jgi:hypothetical protein
MAQSTSAITERDKRASDVWLELERTGAQKALRVPVTILTLAEELVTLEISQPWFRLSGENLKGRKGRLCLDVEEGKAPLDLKGLVTSSALDSSGQTKPTLGLRLAHPTPNCRKALEDLILHTTHDIRHLWNKWDEAHRRAPKLPLCKNIIYGAILVLILIGMIMSLTGVPWLQKMGNGMMFVLSLAGAGYCWKSIRLKSSPPATQEGPAASS